MPSSCTLKYFVDSLIKVHSGDKYRILFKFAANDCFRFKNR
ncbi:hypothetical protein yinte0001_9260 [Yersinia intermedia ATCC 29909]|nr:hypothetical protein yinte0001_9260 [Yersinia intermedia ATCC 29909]